MREWNKQICHQMKASKKNKITKLTFSLLHSICSEFYPFPLVTGLPNCQVIPGLISLISTNLGQLPRKKMSIGHCLTRISAIQVQADIMVKKLYLPPLLSGKGQLFINLRMTWEFFSSFPLSLKLKRESTLRGMKYVLVVPAGI